MRIFLKLGGSLITDKNTPHTARFEILKQLCAEIQQARSAHPDLQLLVGHGSGSFGHVPAHTHQTRGGVYSAEGWLGFAEVWREARALNEIVMQSLLAAGIPALAFPPSANFTACSGKPESAEIYGLSGSLQHGLVPVVCGDVVFDHEIGGTILSTEDVFSYLTPILQPDRILLAGIDRGVWKDFPACNELIPIIRPETYPQLRTHIFGSASTDVTGGMAQKVELMVNLVHNKNDLECLIFSGETPGNVLDALEGKNPGTIVQEARA